MIIINMFFNEHGKWWNSININNEKKKEKKTVFGENIINNIKINIFRERERECVCQWNFRVLNKIKHLEDIYIYI